MLGGIYIFANYRHSKTLSIVSNKLFNKKPINTIANIPLYGEIHSSTLKSSPFSSAGINPRYVRDNVEKALDKDVRGILFEINSLGGGVAPSKEITDYINEIDIPTVALVKNYATSGGYMIASACDKIVIAPQGLVGTIGVILPHTEYSILTERLGIKYDGIKAGKYKDIASSFRSFTDDERKILEDELIKIHAEFITEISENRHLNHDSVSTLANGLVYPGKTAVQNKLVDKLGYPSVAIKLIEELGQFEHSKIIDIPRKKRFESFSNIFKGLETSFGQGIYESLLNTQKPPNIR